MPYNNYSFVIDSSFQPFNFQEMLTPWMMYGNAYKEVEDTYMDLSDKSNQFKYLSETLPEGSKARKIYEGYANDLKVQAEDLARNGLSINNRRALTGLKRRFSGEMGRLIKADEALQKEKELRRSMNAKDSSMLYALDNLDIDQFLDENTPNTYGISGNELYARGAAAGKAASSRYYDANDGGSTLGGYYRQWKEEVGVSPEKIAAFMNSDEVQQEVDKILAERGVTQNLTGINYERARQGVLNGIYDSIVYQESVKPLRDEGVMSAAQQASQNLQAESQRISAAANGMVKDENGNYRYDIRRDPKNAGSLWMYKIDDNGNITGYSDEYLKLVNAGKINPNGTPKKQTNSSNGSRNGSVKVADPKIAIDKDGNTSNAGGQNYSYGVKVNFEDAVKDYPAIEEYDPRLYDFYEDKNKKKIHPRPKPGATVSTTTSTEEDNGDDDY